MSADGYSVCPRCLDNARRELAVRAAEVQAMYGVAPPTEYTRALQSLPTVDPESFRTFREEYEVGLRHEYEPGHTGRVVGVEGTVRWSYGGGCDVCGLVANVTGDHPFWTPDGDGAAA